MEIVQVKLTTDEVNFIFNELIDRIQPYKAKHNPKGHDVNFDFIDHVSVWANIHLTTDEKEFNKEDKTLTTTYIVDFTTCLFYDKISVEGLEHTNIEDRIKEYYAKEIQQL